ncbi:MAG: dnaJ 1 [Planctomycetaceae bacterium]|nr:dnaJ 1 [Planctomycetaceae bacterium]
MTDHHLSEDFASWPNDPYTLLGVNAGIDERGLKRAYARLIRTYKPEHHPREFARIRAAFEQLQSHIEWLAQWQSKDLHTLDQGDLNNGDKLNAGAPNESDLSNDNPSELIAASDSPAHPNAPKQKTPPFQELNDSHSARRAAHRPATEESIEKAWQAAIRGNPDSAYEQLLSLTNRRPIESAIYIRLYWLLRLFPKLEAGRHPADWLIIALRDSRVNGPAWELYCSELHRHSHLVFQEEHRHLLTYMESPERLFELLEHRWRAASRHNAWNLICDDIKEVRNLVKDKDLEIWARILFRAVSLAAWSTDAYAREIVNQCELEIEQFTELHFQLGAEFDRHDHLVAMLAETPLSEIDLAFDDTDRHDLIGEDFAQLIRDTWTESRYQLEPRIQLMLESWVTNPSRALLMLTEIRKHASFAFHQIRDVVVRLDQNEINRNSPSRAMWTHSSVLRFLMQHRNTAYPRFRSDVLEFCVATGIDVSAILKNHERLVATQMRKATLDKLRQDVALETVVRGILAFWAC